VCFSCLWRRWYFPFSSRWRSSMILTRNMHHQLSLFLLFSWHFCLFCCSSSECWLVAFLQVKCKWHTLHRPLGTNSFERATTLMGPLLHTPPAEVWLLTTQSVDWCFFYPGQVLSILFAYLSSRLSYLGEHPSFLPFFLHDAFQNIQAYVRVLVLRWRTSMFVWEFIQPLCLVHFVHHSWRFSS